LSKRKKLWLAGITIAVVLAGIGAYIAASIVAKRFEPELRTQAIRYLQNRFHADVELAALHVNRPKMSTVQILLRHGRGALVTVVGEGFAIRRAGDRDRPPLFSIQHVAFTVDLGVLFEPKKSVNLVSIDGMEINIPPKGERRGLGGDQQSNSDVDIQSVQINNAVLVLLPKDSGKQPLKFQIARLHLHSAGENSAMRYDADLTIPKPPGIVKSTGNFGPWNASEPGDTPLQGNYTFDNADLGIFAAIGGTLSSKGTFDGSLSSINAHGTANVPNFQLKMSGNPVPLSTTFEAQVDGTNGNTILQPVRATLGHTNFTTAGAVINYEEYSRHGIDLKVNMPNGDLRDLLRLSMKGPPFMEGVINMQSSIVIPPLTTRVKQKLLLDGTFDLHDAKFLKSTVQDQIDQLSRRGQGRPKDQEIDEVVSKMEGAFHLENQVITFRSLAFEVPGASVSVTGDYDLLHDTLDFHGALKLDAKLSETMTGWKRWLLKPADPFFAKNGAGTYAKIKIEGDAHHPKFGLDHGH
jgi:hypothetical protein